LNETHAALSESEYEALLVVSVGGVPQFFKRELKRLAGLGHVVVAEGTPRLTDSGEALLQSRWERARPRPARAEA